MPHTIHLAAILIAAPALTFADPSVTATPTDTSRPYGTKGVREAGASAGFMVAPDLHSVTIAPSFGWFIADGLQVSTIVGLTSLRAGSDNAMMVSAILEPSYHLRIDQKTHAFAGLGFGYSYVQELGNGLTYAVRLGTQFTLGRSGVLTPSVSYDFRTNSQEQNLEMPKLTQIASESALRINLGYTSIW